MTEFGLEFLRQFTNEWWREGQPYDLPENSVKMCAGSHEVVLFRRGQFQVEMITLLPGIPVPAHIHPNVDTYECHLSGSGHAWIEDRMLPYSMEGKKHHPKARRLLIKAGELHGGQADTVVVALSFQFWRGIAPPTFITDDWVGDPWT